jgi:hypothetical protein
MSKGKTRKTETRIIGPFIKDLLQGQNRGKCEESRQKVIVDLKMNGS